MMIEYTIKRLKRYQSRSEAPVKAHYLERQQAAVLLAITNAPDPALILTERAAHLGSHGGEVAWPGGKQDEGDSSLMATALRESEEEIGLPASRVNVLAQLRPFTSKFGLAVTPFIGLIQNDIELQANEDEISAIFRLPLSYLLDDPRTTTSLIERHGESLRAPEYQVQGFRIWGLTALILAEFMKQGMGMDLRLSSDGDQV